MFHEGGLKLQHVHTDELGSTWLINICLAAVKKKSLSLPLPNVILCR